MEACLQAHGRNVGRRPAAFAVAGLMICFLCSLGWLEFLRRDPTENVDDLELMWSVRGGHLEQEIKWMKQLHNKDPWEQKAIMTYFLGQGRLQGADIARAEVFEEMLSLYKRFHDLQVTTSNGLVYTARDLCARGSLPDYPGSSQACSDWEATNRTDAALQAACNPSPVFPCLLVSPVDCFSEVTEALDRSYIDLDRIIDVVLPDPALAAKPYATRPSFRNLTDGEIRAEIAKSRVTGAKGCPWWMETVVFGPSTIAGGLQWSADGSTLERVSAFRWIMFLEGPRRAAFRMSLSKPQHADEASIEEALGLLDKAWESEVIAFNQQSASVEMSSFGPTSIEVATDENTQPAWGQMVLCGVLINLFMTVSLGSMRYPLLSRLGVASLGLAPVLLSVMGAGGIILVAGLKLNRAIIMCMPFLAMGLGVDDLFVLLRYFSGLGLRFIAEKDHPEILAEVFRQAGVGVTLTSLCNICAFAAGILLPVPAMSDFCLAAAVVAAMNYMTMMTVVPGLLVMEAKRIKRREPEISVFYCCHRRRLKSALAAGEEPAELSESGVVTSEQRFVSFLKGPFSSALTNPVTKALAVPVVASLVGATLWSISRKSIGYKISDMVPQGTSLSRALELSFQEFTLFPSMLCFVDVDVPTQQAAMLELYSRVTSTPTTSPGDTLPYLTMFYFHLLSKGQETVPGLPNQTFAEQGWQLHGSYIHQLWAQFGIASQDSDIFYEQYSQFKHMPLDDPAKAFVPGNDAFASADVSAVNEFSHVEGRPDAPLRFSFFRFYQKDLQSDQDYLDSIQEVRAIVDDSPLRGRAFPAGPIFTFWSVFIELEGALLRAMVVDMGIIFCCTLLLLRSPIAALLSTLACSMIVLEVYGICMTFLQFNIFIAATLLAAAGISVEFTAHLVAAFYQADPELTTRDRLSQVLAEICPAVFQGSVSTLMGILPMAFTPIPFILQYMFAPFALVVAVGLINGIVILPAMMALFACPCLSNCGKGHPSHETVGSAAPQASESLPTILQGDGGRSKGTDTSDPKCHTVAV